MTTRNDSAYARPASTYPDEDRPTMLHYFESADGLTKREYFAAMAMQGLIATVNVHTDESDCADTCTKFADALIDALNQQKI